MRKNLVIAIIASLFSASCFSLETDNFLTWGLELKDSSTQINDYINKKIQSELIKINKKRRKYSCETVRDKLIVSFRGFITHPMEHWIESSLEARSCFSK